MSDETKVDPDETTPDGWRNRAPTPQEFVLHYEAHRILDSPYSVARWQYERKDRGHDHSRYGERQVGPATEFRPEWVRSRPLTAQGDAAPWPVITERSRLEYAIGLAREAAEAAEHQRASLAQQRASLAQQHVAARMKASKTAAALSVAVTALAEFDMGSSRDTHPKRR